MKPVAAYIASRRRSNSPYGDESRMGEGDRRYENMPVDPEMRRRRDGKGRYMGYDPMEPDRDEREDARAYDARNEYTPQREEYGRAESTYRPMTPRAPAGPQGGLYDGGGIGFGTRDREYQTRAHYGGEHKSKPQNVRAEGTFWMAPGSGHEPMEMDRETAEEWVSSMRNEDSSRPTGGKWTMEELEPMARKMGIEPDTPEFYELYAMTNAMYSDYCAVAKKYNIVSPEFYVLMAKAWMDDKDAAPGKTAMYYKCCVRHA